MFCRYCGKQIKENISFCPYCGKSILNTNQLSVPYSKDVDTQKQVNEKKEKMNTKRKGKKRFWKVILSLLLLFVITGATIWGLTYIGIIDIPILSELTSENQLEDVSQKCIEIKELDVVMESETEGTATIHVQIPNYELLFQEASKTENPEQYLLKALKSGNYDIEDYEKSARVTVEDGETVVHSDEVVHQLLEEALVNAINALSEGK